jgi:D-serine dehydratase
LYMLWIEPKMIVTAPELRNLPVSKRQCYFNNERYLRFFRYYTQNNCETECLANIVMSPIARIKRLPLVLEKVLNDSPLFPLFISFVVADHELVQKIIISIFPYQ